MREVKVVGAGMTSFGKFPDRSVRSLSEEAVAEALASRQPALHGAVAPARGLCLRRVVLGRRTTERSREIREP